MNGFWQRSSIRTLGNAPRRELPFSLTNLLLFSFGYLPLLAVFFLNLWARPHYQFFPLALAGAGFLAWVRLKELPRPLVPSRPLIGGLWLLASFAIVLVATILWSPWLGSLAVLAGLIGVIWLLGGRRLLRAMCPALILALVIVPPPLSLDSRFAEHLRLLAVNWSSQLLDLLEVTHARSGNIIELPGQKLLVEEACSGINSILITLAACLFYMLWRRASVIRILLSLSAAVSFVLLGNLLRIILGAWLRFRHGVDILSGWPHQIIGLVLFITYVGLIFSMERLLFFLTSPSRRQKTSAVAKPAVAVSPTQPIWRFSPTSVRVVACAFAITGVAEVARGWVAQRQAPEKLAVKE